MGGSYGLGHGVAGQQLISMNQRPFLTREEKRAMRETKREEREKRKEIRREEREMRKEAKELRMEGREKREKGEKGEKRQRREAPANILEELPHEISHLYLDGNNMMFVANCLRNMTLHKNKKKVEQLLARLAVQFLGASSAISKTILVFDDTRAKSELTLRAAAQGAQETAATQEFELCSARPRYATSDDAIVEWVANVRDTPGVKICVTSDRGLMERVENEGGRVMKPKRWMLIAASRIAGREITHLDGWMEEWCNLQTDV
eukprot:Phypoly_transcript_15095.p1 GENE.Phypoly_transcript_15095~~Phypoly_transcript_15095.p1  ORF type:complete len:294 (+),score=64.81 Phypoly_transcript_15095:94-882(+)